MDEIDQMILYYLLQDGRMTQRLIARNIGISAQTLNYRITKLTEEGVIKNFIVYADPALYGELKAFAAFQSDDEIEPDYFIKIKCLEKITLYGIIGKTAEEISSKIDKMSRVLGEPVMTYNPTNTNYAVNSNSIDHLIVDQLRKMPKSKLSDISKALNLPSMRVKRRYNYLTRNKLIKVLPLLDFSKNNSVIFAIFSKKTEEVEPLLSKSIILKIGDTNSGIFICYGENMPNSKTIINRVRAVEKDPDVMVVYDYDFLS